MEPSGGRAPGMAGGADARGAAGADRPRLRLVGRPTPAERPLKPTEERSRHGAASGGVVALATADGENLCHGIRYPLLIDYLRDAGRLSAADHEIALRVRSLYERTGFRAHLTGSYAERTSRTTNNPDQEAIDDAYRRLDTRVLRRAGRDAWTALRAIVIEDRMTPSARFLPRALKEAERWL